MLRQNVLESEVMAFLTGKQIRNIKKSHDGPEMAFTKYFYKLEGARGNRGAFNPTVVQSTEEFGDMLTDIVTRAPVTLHTVHLPPGYTMQDERLRNKHFPIVRKSLKLLEPGEMPQLPPVTIVADVHKDLIPPRWQVDSPEAEQRLQIVAPEYLPVAEYNGEVLTELGRPERLRQTVDDKPHFSPSEIPEASVPHRRVSLLVEARAAGFLDAEKKRKGYF